MPGSRAKGSRPGPPWMKRMRWTLAASPRQAKVTAPGSTSGNPLEPRKRPMAAGDGVPSASEPRHRRVRRGGYLAVRVHPAGTDFMLQCIMPI